MVGGFLSAMSLLTALMALRKSSAKLHPASLIVSLILLILAINSGLFSDSTVRSSVRGFVLMTTGLGGFWCGQILLGDNSGKRYYIWLCTIILVGFLIMSCFTYLMWGKTAYYFLDPNPKTMINRILLLSFGPIAMIGMRSWSSITIGITLLCASFLVILGDAVFFGRFMHTAVVIFIVLIGLALFSHKWRLRQLVFFFLGGILIMVVAVYVFHPLPVKVGTIMSDTRTQYRIENYPFSWHIAQQHPMLGTGLDTRLAGYLGDYHERYAHWADPRQFNTMVSEINSPDSTYLAFMVYLGIPFLIVYILALLGLLARLFRALWRPPPELPFHPLALAIPVLAAVLHFVDLEGLLFEDINWFFHVLLGMIPVAGSSKYAGKSSY
jgi:O-antigen ligase